MLSKRSWWDFLLLNDIFFLVHDFVCVILFLLLLYICSCIIIFSDEKKIVYVSKNFCGRDSDFDVSVSY